AFVKLTPSTDGLLHISQVCEKRVENIEDCLHVGDIVRVRIQEIDRDNGKISLSRRDLDFPDGDPILERLNNMPDRPPRDRDHDRDSRPPRDRDGGGSRDRDRRPGGGGGGGRGGDRRPGGGDRGSGGRDRRDR
ncbi:MAG: S1 RNA-binding domain-containing protein, partial [bacterium]|nr:S1 RNA-binding domain-containing protein [bacterium]